MIDVPQTEYKKQISTMRSWLDGKGYHLALKAFEFAQKHHKGTRKDGVSPEFSHQMFIANYAMSILPGLMFKEETLAAIFLHDVCEDYHVKIEQIEEMFGQDVAQAVRLLTKKTPGEKIPEHEKELRNRRYYEKLATDPIASMAKGLDRAHNILTMKAAGWTLEKQKAYLQEAISLVLPMLKEARRTFTEQRLAYENVKSLILIQAQHINFNLQMMKQLQEQAEVTEPAAIKL
ncbi:HD domain-containing protein [Mesorhizobium sp. SP-1A]|uniref:HD domain-containing protein n=1 Tax=Mesorhizobium sp. SP-1A TaxID=3077840 RepID=UPI0028F6E528|nr:HD domain-containing protein [Mesorhizobium sp. SP-1A]